ncbi:MAG TPA: ribose-phosphate diphosphokinase [Thermoprotei archaeon]|nr:ribose-phosphate diphosphokinase [Thermoprotei archaeon]
MTTIIAPSSSEEKILRMVKDEDVIYIGIDVKSFPNGELLARITDINRADDKILLYFPLFPDTNNNFVLLLQILEIIRYYKENSRLLVIIPYLSYSRQDRRFLMGEALSLKVILNSISQYNPSFLIFYDVHNISSVIKMSKTPFIHLSVIHEVFKRALYKLSIQPSNILLISPDKGREYVVKNLSKKFGCTYAIVSKVRDKISGEVTFSFTDIDMDGFDAVFIVDDEISTGGTMAGVARYVVQHGNHNVYALASHLLLVNNAEERLFKSGVKDIFGSDTIPRKYSIFSIFETFSWLIKSL